MKKTFKNSNLFDFQIQCPIHESFQITHGCFNLECAEQMLFCSSCLLENLTHITEHQKFISPLPNFLDEFYINFSSIKENLKPLDEIRNSHVDFNNMNNWNKLMKEQKQSLQSELNLIKNKLNNKMEQIKESFYEESEKLLKDAENSYKIIEQLLESDNLLEFNYQNKENFIQKLRSLRSYELNDFFLNLRNSLKFFKTPVNSQAIKNYVTYSQTLDSMIKNSNQFNLFLSQSLENLLDQIYTEITDKLKQNLCNLQINKRTQAPSSFKKTQIFENAKTPIKLLKNHTDVSQTISPLLNNNSYNSYFPKKITDSAMKTSSLMNSFRNMNQMNKYDIFETPSQKNFLIKNDLFFTKDNLLKLDVKLSASFDEDHAFSSLCLINLNENILATAGKDPNIRIFEFVKPLNSKPILELTKILRNTQDTSSIWSLAKLSAINYQKNDYGIFYFASGSENGNISIWKLDNKNPKVSENCNKPLIQLIGNPMVEIITSIMDLNDGNHLICGDSKGSLMVWDFLYGKMLQNFEVHRDQINNIVAFNNYENIAVGSYDGNISLWEVSNKNSKNSEKIKISSYKIIKNNFYIYALTALYSRNNNIIVVDSQKKLKVLDVKTMLYAEESEILTKSDTLMDVLCIESIGNESLFPLIFCFTKNQLIVLNGDSLEIIKCFDDVLLNNNNIGATMNSNYKVVFLSKGSTGNLEKENCAYFAIVDQAAKTKRILSVFKISF